MYWVYVLYQYITNPSEPIHVKKLTNSRSDDSNPFEVMFLLILDFYKFIPELYKINRITGTSVLNLGAGF